MRLLRSTLALCCAAVLALLATGCGGSESDSDTNPAQAEEQAGPDTVALAAHTNSGYVYKVILGHDGHPDPDDNLACLAGFMAAKRNVEDNPSQIVLLGQVYGDTTQARRNAMLTGSGTGNAQNDATARANYQYYLAFTVPAFVSVGLTTHANDTDEVSNYAPAALTQITTGGRLIATNVKAAIDNPATKTRVVYSAGGGENAPAQAIA